MKTTQQLAEIYPLHSSTRKPMRGLVQRLGIRGEVKPARLIAFIASRIREGTSTVSREYAQSLAAETGQKVLLIEAGPRRVRNTDDNDAIGIVDMVIAGQLPQDAIQMEDHGIATGRWTVRSENRAAATRMMQNNDFWQALSASFDTIILDAPSLQSSFEGVMLAARADATVIVVEAEKTPRAVVKNLHNTLVAAGAKVAGSVMNKRRYYIPNQVYKKL